MSEIPIVDCRGLDCPMPILRIRLKLNELAPGDTLIAWCTDLSFRTDFARFCILSSVSPLDITEYPDYTAYHIKVNDISHL